MQKNDLHEKLDEWLKTQGYPLEMRTSQFFHQRGWFFHHSRRYVDPTMEKEREIDLIAFYDDKSQAAPTHIHFVIECKWTSKKPWVLFTSSRRSLTPFGYLRSTPMTDIARIAVTKFLPKKDFSTLPLYSDIEEGYAIVQAFTDRVAIDAAYSAVQTVINAADYFAQSMSKKTDHSIIYVPTIILDGDLFQCTLTSEGDTSITEIDMGFLVHHTADENRSVYVVKESGMSSFFDRAETTFQSLRPMLKNK